MKSDDGAVNYSSILTFLNYFYGYVLKLDYTKPPKGFKGLKFKLWFPKFCFFYDLLSSLFVEASGFKWLKLFPNGFHVLFYNGY